MIMEETNLTRRKLMQLLTVTITGSVFLSSDLAAQPDNVKPQVSAGEPKAIFIPPGGGEKGKISNNDIIFKLDKSQTSGNLGSSEEILHPGSLGAPPHYHRTFDEVCIVLEGSLHIMVDDEVVEVSAGGWHLRPRGVIHTFWNSGKVPARFIDLYLPGGHEAYMKELAKLFDGGNRPNPGDLMKLADRHDIVFAFDRLQAIIDKYQVHL